MVVGGARWRLWWRQAWDACSVLNVWRLAIHLHHHRYGGHQVSAAVATAVQLKPSRPAAHLVVAVVMVALALKHSKAAWQCML